MFKNICAYTFKSDELPTQTALTNLAERLPLVDPQPLQSESMGFVSVNSGGPKLLSQEGRLLLRIGINRKTIPASVVTRAVEEKANAYARAKSMAPSTKMRKMFRDDVLLELLPKAFVVPSAMYVWIDLVTRQLMIESSSIPRAETVLTFLREGLEGNLAVVPWDTAHTESMSLSSAMSGWLLTKTIGEDLVLDDSAELIDQSSKDSVVFKNHKLASPDVVEQLDAGKGVSKIGLIYRESMTFCLSSKGVITNLKLLEIKPQYAAAATDDVDLLAAEFALYGGFAASALSALSRLIAPGVSGRLHIAA